MDVMLQRHCARFIYYIPDGLRELMYDISREVLRIQPEETYAFIADYLDALLITRENARVAAKFIRNLEEVSETIVNLLDRTGLSRAEADRITIIIQRAFRHYLERRPAMKPIEKAEHEIIQEVIEEAELPEEKIEEVRIIIQEAFVKFIQKRDEKSIIEAVDWRIAARSTLQLYKKTGLTLEEAHRAATLIQAAYKGYYIRKLLAQLKEEQRRKEAEVHYYELRSTSSWGSEEGYIKHVRFDMEFDDELEEAMWIAKQILEEILDVVCPLVPESDVKAELTDQERQELRKELEAIIMENVMKAIDKIEGVEEGDKIEETPVEVTIEEKPEETAENKPEEAAGGKSEVASGDKPEEIAGDKPEAPTEKPDESGDTLGETSAEAQQVQEAPVEENHTEPTGAGAETPETTVTELETDYGDSSTPWESEGEDE